jgi:hypothetical protein
MVENSIILSSLIKNQREHISLDKKLSFKDLNRISYNLTTNIFTNECSIWNGYITNINSKKKNCYISFFFKNKKVSLHRLLFANYTEDINDNEYIKYICNNKGKCCTINHMKKTLKDDYSINKDGDNINNKDDDNINNEDDDNINNEDDDNINNEEDDNINNEDDDNINKTNDDNINKTNDNINEDDDNINEDDDNINTTNNTSKNRVYF